MSRIRKPPDEVFCLRCGPGTVMDADPSAGRLVCPRCGEQYRLRALPLFVVTGASGAGKTTITEPLRGLLPRCLVFEADTTLHIAALGWATWRNTWLQLAHANSPAQRHDHDAKTSLQTPETPAPATPWSLRGG
jgi:ribosomal protein S27AE